MDKFLVAVAISLVTTAGASEADLYAAPPATAPIYIKAPPATYSWTGFYAGVHAGWGWTADDSATATSSSPPASLIPPGAFFTPLSFNLDGDSAVGGWQIGFNWQVASTWVFGIEGDFS